jgi:hypothetical protein
MCPSSGWGNLLIENAIKFISDYGATTVHLDVMSCGDLVPCYDKTHTHKKPDENFEADLKILEEMRKRIREFNSNATIHAEGINEQYGAWEDVFWTWNSMNTFPEVMRYTIPEYLFTTFVQENEFDKAAKAFVYGILFDIVIELGTGRIDKYPRFCEYIASLANLKAKLKDYLVYSEFKDDLGVKVPEGIICKVYKSNSGTAIPFFNSTSHKIVGKVILDCSTLGITKKFKFQLYSIDGHTNKDIHTSLNEINIEMEPKELKVIVIARAAV